MLPSRKTITGKILLAQKASKFKLKEDVLWLVSLHRDRSEKKGK